ncbi:MAG: cardiolipin synthase B [Spirulinaceae cyanobacterium SM2_1_0]|nr:cardiolipin synthase B [Spirulinaceae cyanobacterium SM2_1_0]
MNLAMLVAIILGLLLWLLLTLYWQGYWRSPSSYHVHNLPPLASESFALAIASLTDANALSGEVTGFWVEAEAIFGARLAAIARAQLIIQFETFIMTPGDRAERFATALCDRAQAGCTVQVLADSYGARNLSATYWRRLRASGVAVRFFNGWNWRDPAHYLRRNHRKLLLIDHQVALVGGAGVSDLWDGKAEGAAWWDYEVALRGSAVTRLSGLFLQHWLDAGSSVDLADFRPTTDPPAIANLLVAAGEAPNHRDSTIRATYESFIQAARRRLWLSSPYFLPVPNTRRLLAEACQRGVEVKILTMGARCDKPFVRSVAREFYGELLAQGIQIYEYQPSMMHAKAMLVDDDWLCFGSANFDPRSFFQNDELNLAITRPPILNDFEHFFQIGFSRSQEIERSQWRDRPWSGRLVGRLLMPLFWQL